MNKIWPQKTFQIGDVLDVPVGRSPDGSNFLIHRKHINTFFLNYGHPGVFHAENKTLGGILS